MSTHFRLTELNNAIAADILAREEAMRRGLLATKPLTATRLGELCVLGEKMMHAKRRKDEALAAASAWMRREKVDLILPA